MFSNDKAEAQDAHVFATPLIPTSRRKHRNTSVVPAAVVLALLVVGAALAVLRTGASKSAPQPLAPATRIQTASLTAPPIKDPLDDVPPDPQIDLENGFSYTRPFKLTSFMRRYPDAACSDGLCTSTTALGVACGEMPCTDGLLGFKGEEPESIQVEFPDQAAQSILKATLQKYGPPDLKEHGGAAGLNSEHWSWFIKGGTFSASEFSGANAYGNQITPHVSFTFTEGEEVAVLPRTKLPHPSRNALDEIERWKQANNDCRGLSPDNPKMEPACELRDRVLGPQLEAQDYCFGRRGDYGFEETWHVCGPRSCKPGMC